MVSNFVSLFIEGYYSLGFDLAKVGRLVRVRRCFDFLPYCTVVLARKILFLKPMLG